MNTSATSTSLPLGQVGGVGGNMMMTQSTTSLTSGSNSSRTIGSQSQIHIGNLNNNNNMRRKA